MANLTFADSYNMVAYLEKLEENVDFVEIVYFFNANPIKYDLIVSKARVETVPNKDYILLPLWTQDLLLSSSSKDSPSDGFKPLREEEKKNAEDL
nr:hypothetical protein [Tanacetum cinerariifolium]